MELSTFALKPKGLSGEELFRHMCKFRNRRVNGNLAPSAGLDIEYTSAQMSVVQPSKTDSVAGNILRSTGGVGQYRMMPTRSLNTVGEINNHCVAANSENRIKRMTNAMELGSAIDTHKVAIARLAVRKKIFDWLSFVHCQTVWMFLKIINSLHLSFCCCCLRVLCRTLKNLRKKGICRG
jgi:hypothetical protein